MFSTKHIPVLFGTGISEYCLYYKLLSGFENHFLRHFFDFPKNYYLLPIATTSKLSRL